MLTNIQPLNGKFLAHFSSVYVTETDSGFMIDSSFELEMHQQITATVIAISEDKILMRDDREITNDILPGDVVILDYLGAQTALEAGNNNKNSGSFFVIDNNLYALINTADVQAIVRDGKLFPASGYILAQEIDKAAEFGGFIAHWDKLEEKRFKVHSVGSKLKYRNYDCPEVSPGNIIQTARFCNFPLEYPGHSFINKESLVLIERHLVYALVQESAA